jgi:hypothetical protein
LESLLTGLDMRVWCVQAEIRTALPLRPALTNEAPAASNPPPIPRTKSELKADVKAAKAADKCAPESIINCA